MRLEVGRDVIGGLERLTDDDGVVADPAGRLDKLAPPPARRPPAGEHHGAEKEQAGDQTGNDDRDDEAKADRHPVTIARPYSAEAAMMMNLRMKY